MSRRLAERQAGYTTQVERILEKITTCTQLPLPFGAKTEVEWQYFEEIYDLQAELIEVQKNADSVVSSKKRPVTTKSVAPIADRLATYTKWLHENGVAEDAPFEYRAGLAEGIGAVATRSINEGDEVIRIPQHVMLTEATAASSARMKAFLGSPSAKNAPSNVVLALHLLEQKFDSTSFWKPYFDVLPESFAVPLFFTPEDMKELEGTSILRDVVEVFRTTLRNYAQLFAAVLATRMIPIVKFTWLEWRWAMGVLVTRQNMIPLKEGKGAVERVLALIPGWDHFNHGDGLPITSNIEFPGGAQVCTSPAAYNEGDQIYLGYMDKDKMRSNRQRFLNTGFLIQEQIGGDYLRLAFQFPQLKDVSRRQGLAHKKFGLREPFPQELKAPLRDSWDNLAGALACALGTAEDLDRIAKLQDLPNDNNPMLMHQIFSVNRDAATADLRQGLDVLTGKVAAGSSESGDGYACTRKIIDYVKLQATMFLRKHEKTANADVEKLNKLRNKSTVQAQFRRNVITYRIIERKVAQGLLDHVESLLAEVTA